MNKKIVISTWCTDDYVDYLGLEKLTNSIKYFHPDVEHAIVDTVGTNKIKEENPWISPVWMMPPTCRPYADEYDMMDKSFWENIDED